jgi:hypothetical protein
MTIHRVKTAHFGLLLLWSPSTACANFLTGSVTLQVDSIRQCAGKGLVKPIELSWQ